MASRTRKHYSQAGRLQDLVRTLMARRVGVTVEELVELYGVTRRTIYRDFDALQEAGYPLYAVDAGGFKRWRLHDRVTQIPPITLSMSELISLYLTKTQITYLKGTPFAADMDNIFDKLEKTLVGKGAEQLRLFAKKFYFVPDAPKSYAKKLDLLYDVMDALIRQYVCKMKYRSPKRGRTTERTIEPLTLLTHKQGLYLLARERGAEGVRTFAVDRIAAFEATAETFEYPGDYSPAKQTEGAFGIVSGKERHKVRLRFAPDVAHLVAERQFHPSQKLKRLSDGSLELEMTLGTLGEELLSFILSHGAKVRVLAPERLKEEISAELRKAAGTYR